MIDQFSAGYYLGRLYVQPFDGERAVIQRDQHERMNEEIYATGEGLERTDAPLVMKLDDHYFPVHGESDVPEDTLSIPEALFEETDVRDPPSLQQVLVAKRDRAMQLLRLGGWQAPAGT